MTHTEIHKQIEDNDVIELYVLNKLSADERRAFQEHFFECDQCFEQAQIAARFTAGVRDASRTGVLAADQTGRLPLQSRLSPVGLTRRWAGGWLMPALAASLLLAVALTALWALSLRRENRQLAELCVRLLDSPSRVEYRGEDPEEGVVWDVSIDKARRELSYLPEYAIEDTVRELAAVIGQD